MKYSSTLFFSLLFFVLQTSAQTYNLGDTEDTGGWFKLGRLHLPQQGADADIKVVAGGGYNAILNQQGECTIHFRTSNGNSNYQGFYGSGNFYNTGKTKILTAIKVVQIDQSAWDFYATLPAYTGTYAALSLTTSIGSWDAGFAKMIPPDGQVTLDLSEELVFSSPISFTQSVGIGTNIPDNQQGWQKVLDVYGSSHAKLLVRSSEIKTGIFSDQTWGAPVGRVGTESNHNLQLMAGYGNTVMALTTTGNVGIGTNSPENTDGWARVLDIHGNGHAKALVSTNNVSTGLWSHDLGYYGALAGGIVGTSSNHPFSIITNSVAKLTVASNGNVGIGTTTPGEKLSVNGKIRAHEIKVETTNWPDYVFEDGYKIGTLQGLESYIKGNKHLPDMPSAKEIETNGLEVGVIIKLQQKKIEELTLYLIDQEKKIDMEKNKIKMLEDSVSELKAMMLDKKK